MKIIKFIICFSFILFSVQSNAQDKNDLDSMINVSILEYVKITNDLIKGGFNLRKINDYSDVYVLTEKCPVGFELTSEVKALGFKAITNVFSKKNIFKKSKAILGFAGPIINKDKIIISLSRASVKSKWKISNLLGKRHLYEGHSGPIICTWKYSQEIEKWTLIDVEDAGI